MQPAKKYFILSLLCMAAAMIIVLTLMIISTNSDSPKRNFKRDFISRSPLLLYHSEKMNCLRAICGIQRNLIYFETDSVGSIIETESTLSNKRLLKFEIPGRE